MNGASIIVQRPGLAATHLVLLHHGVGGNATDMVPLGQLIAEQIAGAFVVAVSAPHASDLGRGLQWFSIAGITETNRVARVAAALPAFDDTVKGWQHRAGLDAAQTTLLGFSQGAIISLESVARAEAKATHVIAIAGRFARPPVHIPAGLCVDVIHGDRDSVMPLRHAELAVEQLRTLGARVSKQVVSGLAHDIDARAAQHALQALEARI